MFFYIVIAMMGIIVARWIKIFLFYNSCDSYGSYDGYDSYDEGKDKKREIYEIKIFSLPVFEGINGILYSIIFTVNGKNAMSAIYCLMASILFLMAIIDEYTYEIPFLINVFLGILGIIATVLDREQLKSHLAGAILVSGILFILYCVTGGVGIGGGDIKLMAASGLLIGWRKIILALFIGCISGLLIQGIRMIWMRKRNLHHMFAMGPYLAVGIFVAAIWGEKWEMFFPFFFPFC